MKDKTFLDSNILVYAYDEHDTNKQSKAQSIISKGISEENLVISAQVLGEFFVVITRQINEPMSPDDAKTVIRILSVLPVIEIDLAMVNRAIQNHKEYQISYWNSLIVAAAERAGCTTILTEDLNDGQKYNDIIALNPFSR